MLCALFKWWPVSPQIFSWDCFSENWPSWKPIELLIIINVEIRNFSSSTSLSTLYSGSLFGFLKKHITKLLTLKKNRSFNFIEKMSNFEIVKRFQLWVIKITNMCIVRTSTRSSRNKNESISSPCMRISQKKKKTKVDKRASYNVIIVCLLNWKKKEIFYNLLMHQLCQSKRNLFRCSR